MSTATTLLAYPRRRDDWAVGLAIGGVCLALAALVVPLIVVYGYLVRVARSVMAGETTPPSFADPVDLLADGVRGLIIGFAYLLVPLLIGGLTIGGAVRALLTGGEVGQVIGFWTLFLGGFLTILVTIAFGYLAAGGILAYARHGNLIRAFDPRIVSPIVRSAEVAIAYAAMIVLASVGFAVTAVPVIGWLLGPFALWYMLIVGMALLAGAVPDGR